MKKISFTGTRDWMTHQQKYMFKEFLKHFSAKGFKVLIHGDCIGADADAHKIAAEMGFKMEVHPCTIESARAHCKSSVLTTFAPKPPLDRNKDIVDSGDMLIATPKEDGNVLRSGTWSTIRYGIRVKITTYVIFPNGIWVRDAEV